MSTSQSRRRELILTLERLTRIEDREVACLDQGPFEQIGWDNRLLWMERWHSQQVLEVRLISEPYTTLMGAAEVLGTIEDIRTVEFTSSPQI